MDGLFFLALAIVATIGGVAYFVKRNSVNADAPDEWTPPAWKSEAPEWRQTFEVYESTPVPTDAPVAKPSEEAASADKPKKSRKPKAKAKPKVEVPLVNTEAKTVKKPRQRAAKKAAQAQAKAAE